MIILNKINGDLFYIIILPTIIFLAICFSFIASNINQFELNIQSLILMLVVFESAILFLYLFVKWLNLNVHLLRCLSFFLVIFFLLQWYFNSIHFFIKLYIGGSHKYVLLFFFLLSSALLSVTAKNNVVYRLFVNFCLIFFVLNFSKLAFAVFTKPDKLDINSQATANQLPYQAHSSQQLKNIYYFVTDELGTEKGLRQANVDTTFIHELKKELTESGFTVLEKNLSSYNLTYLSIQSIFNMDYPVDEQSSRYNSTNIFYSNSLKQHTESLLEKQLKTLGYEKFVYFGNEFHNCNALRKNIICGSGVEKSFIKNVLTDYTLNMFIETSLFKSIVGRLAMLYGVGRLDTLDYVSEYLRLHKKNVRPQFLFAHVIMPHSPFRTQTCERDERYQTTGVVNKLLYFNLTKKMYSNSIKCLTKQLLPILKFISKQDPDAIIIVQGDHGSGFYYEAENAWNSDNQASKIALNERFSGFNAIKMPSSCVVNLPVSLGNVNTIRLALACAAGIKPKLLEEKHFIAHFETHHDFGKVYRYTTQEALNS